MLFETDSSRLQNCPAEVDMVTGDIYINTDVWDGYTEAEKRFIIGHESGHYALQTGSEQEADAYALEQNFGQIRDSLRSSFTALDKADVENEARWNALYINALEIDARNGNTRAANELKKLSNKPMKKQNKMRSYPGQVTYIQPAQQPDQNQRTYNMRRFSADGGEGAADGGEGAATETPTTGKGNTQKQHKTNGIAVGSMYFSFTNIMLVAIAIILIIKLN